MQFAAPGETGLLPELHGAIGSSENPDEAMSRSAGSPPREAPAQPGGQSPARADQMESTAGRDRRAFL